MADLETLQMDDLIMHTSWVPPEIQRMIPISEPPQPTGSQRFPVPASSSLGPRMNALPLELLQNILELLDFRTLSRLSQVSRLAKYHFETLPAYRDVQKHASRTLITLQRTRLITVHSAAAILAALRTDRCPFCGDFGPFLFLLTCERCCFNCLERNTSLTLLDVKLARNLFRLPGKDFNKIPAIYSAPGLHDGVLSDHFPKQWLVSLRHVKDLAISRHGQAEAFHKMWDMRDLLEKRARANDNPFDRDFLNADTLCELIPTGWFMANDIWRLPLSLQCEDTGSLLFPSVRGNSVEEGLWCRGCEFDMSTVDYAHIVHRKYYGWRDQWSEWTARTKSEHQEHIKHCEGGKRFLPEL